MEQERFDYVIYIAASPEKIWHALTTPELTERYWRHRNVSDWKPGSRWEHLRSGRIGARDIVGRVLESSPPRRLVLTWATPEYERAEEALTRVTLELEPFRGGCRLTLLHENLEADPAMLADAAEGWPLVLSSLKSLMETGKPLPEQAAAPGREPAGGRRLI